MITETIELLLEAKLKDGGLWPSEAKAVLQSVKSDSSLDMDGRWGDSTGDYPPQLITTLWVAVCDHAVKWIDANRPQHFARGSFL